MKAGARLAAEVPVIETERLILRGYRQDDFIPIAATWSDPIVIRHTSGRPLSSEEAWSKALRNAGLWPVYGWGYWVIEEKSSRQYLGETGFADFKRDMSPSVANIPEIGWILVSRAHGKGYASEAVRAALAWGDQHFNGRTVCIIHEDNAASIRLAERVGYREYDRTIYREQPVILFERTAPASPQR